MKKISIISLALTTMFLVGCSTKEYFSPEKEEIKAKINYDEKLPQDIKYMTLNGATYKDGVIISKDGTIEGIKLNKDEKFLSKYENKILYSKVDGEFKIVDMKGNLIFEKNFPVQVVSGSINGDDLAIVCADNSFYLIKLSLNQISLYEKLEDVYGIDSRVADPLFIDDVIIYPTLNGRVLVVHKKLGRIVQDAFISTEPFFNNIIYLDSVNSNLYIATSTNLVLITSKGNRRLSENIKNIFRYQDKIYIFNKEGVAKVYDFELNELAQNKFKFAIFSNVGFKDNKIYMFEKMGYIIKTDINLQNPEIYDLRGELEKQSFVTKDKFYYGNRSLRLK